MLSTAFFRPAGDWRFTPEHAAVAIIVVEDERVLVQRRDDIDDLVFPGYWGLFGGGMNEGEQPEEALRRELFEELRLDPPSMSYFTAVDFDFGFCGKDLIRRRYFVVNLEAATIGRLTLGEGAAMGLFSVPDLLTLDKVVPFDAWALWLFANRHGLAR